MYGYVRWNNTVNTRSLRNVQNVSCWHFAVAAPLLQVENTEIFMRQTRNAGKKYHSSKEYIMSELMDIILHRRSIRRFETRQIEENALQEILKAGMYAPSAGGRQGVLFAVCQNEEVNKRLGRMKRVNSNPKMATAANYVSREQPSIADYPNIKYAFFDGPTVFTLFAP